MYWKVSSPFWVVFVKASTRLGALEKATRVCGFGSTDFTDESEHGSPPSILPISKSEYLDVKGSFNKEYHKVLKSDGKESATDWVGLKGRDFVAFSDSSESFSSLGLENSQYTTIGAFTPEVFGQLNRDLGISLGTTLEGSEGAILDFSGKVLEEDKWKSFVKLIG